MVNGGAVVADEAESQHPRHSAQELERRQRAENHLRPAKFAGRVECGLDRRSVGQHFGNPTETYVEQPMENFHQKGHGIRGRGMSARRNRNGIGDLGLCAWWAVGHG